MKFVMTVPILGNSFIFYHSPRNKLNSEWILCLKISTIHTSIALCKYPECETDQESSGKTTRFT
jgi:hypothetical protein